MERAGKVTLLVILFSVFQTVFARKPSPVLDLQRSLIKDYDRNIIPRNNHAPLNINVSFNLLALLRFDEKEETLITAAWLGMSWQDPVLAWQDKPEFENITEIFLQQKQIWKPDIMLVNTVEHFKSLGSGEFLVSVEANGNVYWEPGHRFKTSCSVNIKLYPFDNQQCSLIFSTWMHIDSLVVISSISDRVSLATFEENGEWDVISTKTYADIAKQEDYGVPMFVVKITLERRKMYYILTVCIPIIVLSILNCMVYVLPPNSGEKISFCLTVLLAYMVFMSFLSESLPRTSNTTSYLVVYLSLMICLSFLSVINSVIVLFFWHKPNHTENETKERDISDNDLPTKEDDNPNSIQVNRESNGSHRQLQQSFRNALTRRIKKTCLENTQQFARRLDAVLFICLSLLTIIITGIITFMLLYDAGKFLESFLIR